YEDAYQRSQEEIKKLIPIAAEKGVRISIENVWNKFLLSPIEFVNYIDEFESDSIGAYFDVGNILLYGFPQHWIRSIGERMDKVHIKGFNTNGFR
ncbi:MAG: TIM barrel protein, partial [Candidatus Poribacteria bacterium]|nr:TIM barrel protein [Candidatus Poribacteria bacterium]